MANNRMEGKGKEAAGWVQDKAGELTGDKEMESRGEGERVEGKAQGALGKLKDAAGDAADAVKGAVKR